MAVSLRTGQQGLLSRQRSPASAPSGLEFPGWALIPKAMGKPARSQHAPQTSKQVMGLARSPRIFTLMGFPEPTCVPGSQSDPSLGKPQFSWTKISRCPEAQGPEADLPSKVSEFNCPTQPIFHLPQGHAFTACLARRAFPAQGKVSTGGGEGGEWGRVGPADREKGMIGQKPEGGSQGEAGLPHQDSPPFEAGLSCTRQLKTLLSWEVGQQALSPWLSTHSSKRVTLLSKSHKCSFKGSLRRQKAWVGRQLSPV